MHSSLLSQYLVDLKTHNHSLPILDLACGGGRNGLFCLEKNFPVVFSDVRTQALDDVKQTMNNDPDKYSSTLAKFWEHLARRLLRQRVLSAPRQPIWMPTRSTRCTWRRAPGARLSSAGVWRLRRRRRRSRGRTTTRGPPVEGAAPSGDGSEPLKISGKQSGTLSEPRRGRRGRRGERTWRQPATSDTRRRSAEQSRRQSGRPSLFRNQAALSATSPRRTWRR